MAHDQENYYMEVLDDVDYTPTPNEYDYCNDYVQPNVSPVKPPHLYTALRGDKHNVNMVAGPDQNKKCGEKTVSLAALIGAVLTSLVAGAAISGAIMWQWSLQQECVQGPVQPDNSWNHCLFATPDHRYKTKDICCSVQGPLTRLNFMPARVYAHVFNALRFSCRGRIIRWQYYAFRRGVFYASVWRKKERDGLVMIGKNRLVAHSQGVHSEDIECEMQIEVGRGDLVGIHFASDVGDGVVMYEVSVLPRTYPLNSTHLDLVYRIAAHDANLNIGKLIPFSEMYVNNAEFMTASITAYVK